MTLNSSANKELEGHLCQSCINLGQPLLYYSSHVQSYIIAFVLLTAGILSFSSGRFTGETQNNKQFPWRQEIFSRSGTSKKFHFPLIREISKLPARILFFLKKLTFSSAFHKEKHVNVTENSYWTIYVL